MTKLDLVVAARDRAGMQSESKSGQPISAVIVFLVVACAGEARNIVSSRDLPASRRTPHVERVLDLGNLNGITESDPLPVSDSDGKFVVGEHILIEGKNFGRQPTVIIGGRPAALVARTKNGGIVVRIPSGVAAGKVAVEVSHPAGKHGLTFDVHRFILGTRVDTNAVYVAKLEESGLSVLPTPISARFPRGVRFSPDGSMGYVITRISKSNGLLMVIAMGAKGGPRITQEIPLLWEALGMAVAARAPLLAAVGQDRIELYSLEDPQNPLGLGWLQLPESIRGAKVADVELDNSGQSIAILYEDNRLLTVDVSRPQKPFIQEAIDLTPGEANVLKASKVRFSSDSKSILVLIAGQGTFRGDNRIVKLVMRTGRWALDKSITVASGTEPIAFAVGQTQNFRAGAAVQEDRSDDSIFLAVQDETKRTILRLSEAGSGDKLTSGSWNLSAIDFSPVSQVLVGAACIAGQGTSPAEFGIAWVELLARTEQGTEQSPDQKYAKFANPPGSSKPPCFAWAADIRVQP